MSVFLDNLLVPRLLNVHCRLVWPSCRGLVNLLELPREARGVQERPQVKAYVRNVSIDLVITKASDTRLSSGLYCSYTAFSNGQYPQSVHPTPAYRMVRWREGRHLMPVPRVLEEEMLDLLRDLRVDSQHMSSIRNGLSNYREPVGGIERSPIRAQAS